MKKIVLQVKKNNYVNRTYTLDYDETEGNNFVIIINNHQYFIDENGIMDNNNIITVAEKLYYEANPNTKKDVPSFAYEQVETENLRRIKSQSKLSLYDWCKQELNNN